jgi:molecular chaperone GrpE
MTDPTARAQDEAAVQSEAPAALDDATVPEDQSAALSREVAELKDRLLRTLAEMENLRRRTEREVGDARTYAVSNFARDILGVADNMRRAIETLGPEGRQNVDPGVKALIEGVELTERELLKVLEKNGVKKLEPKGEKFDPNLHQAMYEVPDPSLPAGQVVQVVQDGYTIGDRILRPALVAVAKGGAKAPPNRAGNENFPPGGFEA